MSVDRERSLPEQLSFEGRDGEDVTHFLRNVRRVALFEGHSRDDQWLIDYTGSCLAGPVLKWHLDLDKSILVSWRELQKALLTRFGSDHATPTVPQPLAPVSSLPPLPIDIPFTATKYLLLGDSGVGKSSLLARCVNRFWTPNITPTIGIEYELHHIWLGEKQGQRHFWDPSGSEQYKELRQKYYLGIDFFWLVYDVTDRASFEHIQDWVACARKTAPNSLGMYLVGNKSDLHDKRAVSTKEGIALAKKLILIWAGETSAKTNSGVQGLLGGWAPRMKQLEDV